MSKQAEVNILAVAFHAICDQHDAFRELCREHAAAGNEDLANEAHAVSHGLWLARDAVYRIITRLEEEERL